MKTSGIGVGLLVLSLGVAGGGVALERSQVSELSATPRAATSPSAATPVLSARRVPNFLVEPLAARRLAASVNELLASGPPQRCVVINDGANRIFNDNGNTLLPAASNQKIVTAEAVLDVLGADATVSTKIEAAAAPAGGVVEGDLWMIGGGDPIIDTDSYQLTSKYGKSAHTALEAIADQIKAAGVTSITGSVKADESLFDTQRVVPSWPDRYLKQNQVGPLSAVAVNDSKTYPAVVGATGPTPQPAADPPGYSASALTQLLVARGVTVAGAPSGGVAPKNLVEVVAVPSLPMSAIVSEMLTFSDNNTAELLVKLLGSTKGEGSTTKGLSVVLDSLKSKGFPTEGLVLLDGSGLDDTNRVSCNLLESILRADGVHGTLSDGLAVADGDVGTLRDRYRGSPAAKKVRAKTGTLKSVSALSGWVHADTGRDLTFSIVLNTPGRDIGASDLRLQERITEAMLSYPDTIDPVLVSPVSPK